MLEVKVMRTQEENNHMREKIMTEFRSVRCITNFSHIPFFLLCLSYSLFNRGHVTTEAMRERDGGTERVKQMGSFENLHPVPHNQRTSEEERPTKRWMDCDIKGGHETNTSMNM